MSLGISDLFILRFLSLFFFHSVLIASKPCFFTKILLKSHQFFNSPTNSTSKLYQSNGLINHQGDKWQLSTWNGMVCSPLFCSFFPLLYLVLLLVNHLPFFPYLSPHPPLGNATLCCHSLSPLLFACPHIKFQLQDICVSLKKINADRTWCLCSSINSQGAWVLLYSICLFPSSLPPWWLTS